MPIAPALQSRAEAAARLVLAQPRVLVIHHIDADGVTAGGIATAALERAGIDFETLAVRSLDDHHVDLAHQALAARPALPWFCDLGSTAYMHFAGDKVVCDHHELVRDGSEDFVGHVNPLLDDLPGTDVSGAGACFLVAHAMDSRNADLRPMALVGAAADLQDREAGHFEGSNAAILQQAVDAGQMTAEKELGFYGTETRPLPKFLAYTREHPVPGNTDDQRAAAAFLVAHDIPLMEGARERTWADLSEAERRTVRSRLVERLIDCGLPADGLWRTVVRLVDEPAGPTREVREFGTLLNATARYDRPEIGLAVARGDRAEAYDEAMGLLHGHRKHLASSIQALSRQGIQETEHVQWVHAGDKVRDTVIGIVLGMAMDGLGLRTDKPVIGFAHTATGQTKVSGRASASLQARGIDLAHAMRTAAAVVGGAGGGHKGAAGATIPQGSETVFLDALGPALFDAATTPH